MMANVVNIPSLAFARGTIVRLNGSGPNALVVRCFETTTVVVVCESDSGGTLRLREYQTRDCLQVLENNQP